jgi:hypothetical protein
MRARLHSAGQETGRMASGKLASYIALMVLISGCVTERPVALPNGTQGYAIRCPGAARDISDCMNEAAKVCGGKYQILDRDGNVVGGAAVSTGNGAVWVQGVHRTLIVSCGTG